MITRMKLLFALLIVSLTLSSSLRPTFARGGQHAPLPSGLSLSLSLSLCIYMCLVGCWESVGKRRKEMESCNLRFFVNIDFTENQLSLIPQTRSSLS
jgi:hypothetical protein